MAAQPVVMTGPVWNQACIQATFSENPLHAHSLIKGLRHGVLQDEGVSGAALVHVAAAAIGKYYDVSDNDGLDEETIDLMICGSLGGINLPPPENPREQYLRHIKYFISNHPNAPQLAVDAVEGQYEVQDGRTLPMTFELAYRYVEDNKLAILTNCQIASLIQYLTSMIVSICKTGTVSPKYINKIVQGVEQDLGLEITLSPSLITKFFRIYVRDLTPVTARIFFTQLSGWMPPQALRVKLVIDQTLDHGLTSLNLVIQAFRDHPNFDWAILDLISPGENNRVLDAIRHRNGDQYAGYTRDLGPMAGTKYKHAVYAARQLGVVIRGDTALKKYKGGLKGPIPAIDAAIEHLANQQIPTGEDGRVAINDLTPEQQVVYNGAIAINQQINALLNQNDE